MAEAILKALGKGRFEAFSAGSHPKGDVHPYALDLLKTLNIETGFARPKSWDEFAGPRAPKMDFVLTVCDSAANEACPLWPGRPMCAHWNVPDPAAASGSDAEIKAAFAKAYRMLEGRILMFTRLALKSTDKGILRQSLDEIDKGA